MPAFLTPPAAVLFDCDGVVADSEPATFDLLAEDFGARGLHLTRTEMERLFLGGTIERCGQIAAERGAALPPDWVASFYARLHDRLAAHTPLIPGVTAVFDALDRAGLAYAIASNGSLAKMRITLGQHAGLMARLEGRLFSGHDLNMLKPAPDLYLHAAQQLGHSPARCVVIEDSAPGARAARAAGIPCLGYAPHGGAEALRGEGAQIFTDMADLPGLLGLAA